ncbi:unnamed protein product [Urochloa humidicola]
MGVVTRVQAKRMRPSPPPDLISLLPNELLGTIITLLPTKSGARTQILSRRWRPLWRSAPLNFDARCFDVTGAVVTRILSSHHGPVRRLCHHSSSAGDLDAWLRCPTLDNLEELNFSQGGLPGPLPPPSAFLRFSATLRFAKFGQCQFPVPAAAGRFFHFPKLQELTLRCVSISEDALQALLGCPALSSLILYYNSGFRSLRINSPSLEYVGLYSYSITDCTIKLEDVVVENAPSLEKLVLHHELRVSIVSAPKLEVLGSITDCSCAMQLGSTVFQTLKFGGKNVWCHETPDHIECLDLHLKRLEFSRYRGDKESSHVNLVVFFVLNAKVLESVQLYVHHGEEEDKDWVENQRWQLQLRNRASSGARFDFRPSYCFHSFRDSHKFSDHFGNRF